MIRTLRIKYMMVTMLLALALLSVVFGGLYSLNKLRARDETRIALAGLISARDGQRSAHRVGERGGGAPVSRTPAFVIGAHQDGTVALLFAQNLDATLEGFIESLPELAQAALATGEQQGTLAEYNLSFMAESGLPSLFRNFQQDTQEGAESQPGGAPSWFGPGVKIAFADLSVEKQSIRSALVICAFSFGCSLAGFFVISLFLSSWMTRPIEQAWRQQRRFLADASHELKTPLTVILANTSILESGAQDTVGSQMKWIENTEAEARKMKRLVDQMLFLAKSDGEWDVAEMIPVSLSDIVYGACLAFEAVAFERGITIDTAGIAAGVTLSGDGVMLERMFSALLDNAVKYSPNGETVTVALAARFGSAHLTIANKGEALGREVMAHLFERFYRADSARASDGYGLGLAIAMSIAERHKGTIHVESDAARGTVFTVTLAVK